ncbi:MAG TPA: hypothetical protein VM265_06315 [Sphingomicrobium sp.]|nr:hypothetical protein [Sphingomicrobium sp.]
MDRERGDRSDTPKTKLWGGLVVAALLLAIVLLATGAVKFGPF